MQAPASPLPLGPITRDAEFYPEPFRIQQLKVLLHLAEFTQLCLVLDGPRGVGKSTLLSRFIVEIPENWRVCQMTANAAVSIADLRSALLGTCSIDGDTHGDEELLQHHLAGIRESDLVALLIVDDAETLNNDALRQILTWALPTEGGLHVLLCGTGVYTRLRNPLFSETAATNLKLIELPAFTEEQTAEYAMHRLAAAGQDAASALDDTRLRRVFRASHGLPGHINRELGMLVAPSEQPPTQRLVIFGASAVVICIALAALVTWWITPPSSPPAVAHPRPPAPPPPPAPIARQEPEGVPSLQPLPPDPPPAAPIAVAWIHNQPAQHYTLQIAVAPNEALVRELLAQNPLEGDNAIVALHAARGKTQYALIWGDFANHADAKTARDALPKALRRQQPWIRTFAEVHKQMVQ